MGIGLARGLSGIDSRIAKKIFKSWLITVPAAAIVCIILFLLGRAFLLDFVRELVLAAEQLPKPVFLANDTAASTSQEVVGIFISIARFPALRICYSLTCENKWV